MVLPARLTLLVHADSTRGGSRSAPHDDTAARSTGARGSTTCRSRTAPSTARTSAGTGRRRPSSRLPTLLRRSGQADRDGGMLSDNRVPLTGRCLLVTPCPGRADTRRGFFLAGGDNIAVLPHAPSARMRTVLATRAIGQKGAVPGGRLHQEAGSLAVVWPGAAHPWAAYRITETRRAVSSRRCEVTRCGSSS